MRAYGGQTISPVDDFKVKEVPVYERKCLR